MALWGMSKRWATPFEVTVLGDRRPRGIRVHRSHTISRRDLTTQLGIRVTSAARTVLDCAPRLIDEALGRAVSDARHAGYLKLAPLTDLIDRYPRHRGVARITPLLTTRDGPTRSQWEAAFPAFCERFGLPRPLMSARVCGYTVDALFEAEKLIVELDSWRFHSGREAFERDRDRDADTLAAGLGTLRITWDRLEETPAKEAWRLNAILANCRARA
jgi:hypothetical protein